MSREDSKAINSTTIHRCQSMRTKVGYSRDARGELEQRVLPFDNQYCFDQYRS
jgi:hypothetical protein